MRKSIATVSVSGTLPDKMAAIAAAGFDGFELFENDLIGCPLSPEEIRSRAADLGLGIDLYQPFRDFEAVPADVLAANLRRAEQKFRLMRRLGANLLLVCSNVSPASIGDDALAAEQLRLLAERAAEHGVRIAYEALAWGRHVDDYLHSWRIVRMADHPALGVCLDSFHILSRGADPGGIEAIPGEKIFFLQLADAPRLTMDTLQWSRHYRCFPGQGDFDLTGFTGHVLNAGYDGPLSLEIFNDVFRRSDTARTAVDAMRSLTFLEQSLSGKGAPPAPEGFAFAELAAGADGERLTSVLSALGFERTGTHRHKPVELWTQGRARLLVNQSEEIPALRAIGVETRDPAGSVEHAESLLAPVLPRDRDPEDARLDAVAAPDGTQIFFCRTDAEDGWLADFAPRPAPDGGIRAIGTDGEITATDAAGGITATDAAGGTRAIDTDGGITASDAAAGGITHIDHVALTQPWAHFAEASLFYRSVLGLRPHESLELPDPYGLLRSRAMTGPDGAVRMALNITDVGVLDVPWQHVAVAATDVMAVARALAAIGGVLLPIPDNYYDDLDARFPGAPDLRGTGVLYDRAGDGEFLHLYTITIGRVFFEVVQRIGGYDGYGAANAPVRLAAQHGHKMTTDQL